MARISKKLPAPPDEEPVVSRREMQRRIKVLEHGFHRCFICLGLLALSFLILLLRVVRCG